jgi:hypothetical protein
MDRTIAPLLDPDCVVIVAGDHGESFGEDGYFLHCSALSPVQVQTPFLLAAPDLLQPQVFSQPTAHVDILPTLLDLLGTQVSDPNCLHGTSMFSLSPNPLSTPIVVGESRQEKWILLERIGNSVKGAETGFRIACDPFTAQFELDGPIDSDGWNLKTSDESERQFEPAFDNLVQQLCNGMAPPMPDHAFKSLSESLEHGDGRVRLRAIERLGEMKELSSEAIPALRLLLDDDDPAVRTTAATALSKLKRFEN